MNRGLTPEIAPRSVSELRDRKSIREGREIKSRYACFEKLNGRNLKVLMLLSVVLPIGLLVSFRLAGILQKPTTGTTTLEAVKWEFQRPYPNQYIDIFDEIGSTYTVNEISATLHFIIWDYVPGSMERIPPGDRIYAEIKINATTTDPKGFVDSVSVFFRNDSKPSNVILLRTYINFVNLSLVDIMEERNPEAYAKTYVWLRSVNNPSKIYFSALNEWFLLDASSNRPHQMEVAYELTYYNGTVYKKLIQPFQLKILGG